MLIEHSLTRRDPDTDETSHCSQKRWIPTKGDTEGLAGTICFVINQQFQISPGPISLFLLLPTHEKDGKSISILKQKQEGKLSGWKTPRCRGQPFIYLPASDTRQFWQKRMGEKRVESD